MKAKELMIGDLVYEGTNHQIKIKHNYGKSVRYDEGGYSHAVEEKLINPIPLTPEILEANGIEYQWGDPWYQKGGYPGMDLIEFHFDNRNTIDVKICVKYVHQLQQALRLCGLNELANNFKVE